MPRIAGVNHLNAVRALEKAGFTIIRQGKHISDMSTGRGNRLTGQIGEYLVCAELGRRGFIATPFSGNIPTFDVLATDERCRTVPIQVKSSKSDTFPSDAKTWMRIEFDPETGRQNYHHPLTIENADLIYVCVAIAAVGGRDRFFILTKADLQRVCIEAYSQWMGPKDWKRPRNRHPTVAAIVRAVVGGIRLADRPRYSWPISVFLLQLRL